LHNQEQEERVRQINNRIGPYEYVAAPPELTSVRASFGLPLSTSFMLALSDPSRIQPWFDVESSGSSAGHAHACERVPSSDHSARPHEDEGRQE
jgi:hypothetical protein